MAVAVNQSGEKYRANPAIFAALVQQRINLGNEEVLRQWLSQQTGFNAAKVQAAFDSFSNATQAKQMGALTRKHGIEGTPTLIVGGKYRVIFGNGYEAGMKTVDELIAKVRQERGMPAPRPAPPTCASGARTRRRRVRAPWPGAGRRLRPLPPTPPGRRWRARRASARRSPR